MNKHSPAPWKEGPYSIEYISFDADEVSIARLRTESPAAEANQRLMTAAPEMLEALKALFDNAQVDLMLGGNPAICERIINQAKAAIAKAEGLSTNTNQGEQP